jgi:hypothetical protein
LSDNEEDIDDTTLPPAKTGRRNQKKWALILDFEMWPMEQF